MLAGPSLLAESAGFRPQRAAWDHYRRLRFVLNEPLDHPFFWWPRTLLSYPIDFRQSVDLARLVLTRTDTGERVPIQFSEVVGDPSRPRSAMLHFFSDLPSGARREFVLTTSSATIPLKAQVSESTESNSVILNSGVMRIRIPGSQEVEGEAPGPILQVSRGGGAWIGSSVLAINNARVQRITATRIAGGPLFITYRLLYEIQGGFRYIATVQCTAGMDFVRLQEDMEGMQPGVRGAFTSTWTGFHPTRRQAPNHPIPVLNGIRPYEEYPWETMNEPFPLGTPALPNGQLPFQLGIYQSWTAFRSCTSANFWDQRTGDALGLFIDKTADWQDHEYANHVESEALQVRYFHRGDRFDWQWPITRGSRSVCVAFYDHDKDRQAMHDLEHAANSVEKDGIRYDVGLAYTSHTMFLQNRYGTLDLNCVKDWVLEYPRQARQAPVLFETGILKDAADVERRVMTSQFVCSLPLFGTRENGATGNIPGRGIVNFSPVPSRQILGWWIDGYNRFRAGMTERQQTRVTAIFLLVAYICAGDDFMPVIPMLTGHPNFLADVKANPAAMSFLFPDHPMARTWADMWQKDMALNTRYNTRPPVEAWDARGGRWTENLGTYVWAFLRPSVRVDYLLRQYDGQERFVNPQLPEIADWLVNSLSAPFLGETEAAYKTLQQTDYGHEWGTVAPGTGPRRVHPPQGAHSDRRVPPRSLWYFGTCLRQYAPLAAEHAMWAARPTNQDMEERVGRPDAWDAIYRGADNNGTKPTLRTVKYTGYGITLRAAVDTPQELSIHLQQIDEGANYRWGLAGEGGCGILYFFAAGKAYSFTGSEDVGDRDDQDTDFCTNFGVYKDGFFRSIGMNVLSRPLYDLGSGQFAEIVPREGPTRYSAPEYVGRSVLLAGHDYFVLYDQVLNKTIDHRLSWFVRRGSELPNIQLVRGFREGKEFQKTEIQTEATTGVWFDGTGDSMAVISHRKDVIAKATPFGCSVRAEGVDDLVFRSPEPSAYVEGPIEFKGTAGLVRRAKDRVEFAMFHGTLIAVEGIRISTTDTELGVSGTVTGESLQGRYYAPAASSLRIAAPSLSGQTIFYIDGAAHGRRESNDLILDLPAGEHRWEITDHLPVPIAPLITRTENIAGGATVILTPVAGSTRYRIELSHDSGSTWATAAQGSEPRVELTGLTNETKVHLRAVAFNAMHESEPGEQYPLYVTSRAPVPPDGLHVELAEGSATLEWGEVLGAAEYRLYARAAGAREFRVLYHGLERRYVDTRAGIRASDQNPWKPSPQVFELVEYCVTAVNRNGEGPRSAIANTDPGSWRNWDPRPGEAYRRVASFDPDVPAAPGELPHYYPN
jgi:hypothetical protein